MTIVSGKTVFIAMSGGVDSSVAAALLKKQGYKVVGVHMKCYNVDGCAEADAESARRAAEVLGIPFYVFDFEKAYKEKVVDYMVRGYREGITPNPDVMCNKEIKFGLFLKKALELGADHIATGHYVRLRHIAHQTVILSNSEGSHKDSSARPQNDGKARHKLLQAVDKNKDQSYFLWTLTQEQLRHCLFPIGDYLKPEVRVLARKFGLPNAERKDSQGICFLGKVTLKDFLGQYIKPRKGAVILNDSRSLPAGRQGSHRIIGEHEGVHFYTIGQRHIGIANRRLTQTRRGLTQTTDFKPLYVAEKDVQTNTLLVAEGDDNPALYRKEIELTDINFINHDCYSLIRANKRIRALARVRYRQPLSRAVLLPRQSASKSASVRVLFATAQKAVAPGQSAVFYSKEGEMLGGGLIDSCR